MTCWISVPNKLELDSLLAVIRPYPFCNNNNKWWATETWRCDDQDSTQNISMQIYSHIANCRRSSQHHRTAEEVQLLVIVCLLLTLQNSYVMLLLSQCMRASSLFYFTLPTRKQMILLHLDAVLIRIRQSLFPVRGDIISRCATGIVRRQDIDKNICIHSDH